MTVRLARKYPKRRNGLHLIIKLILGCVIDQILRTMWSEIRDEIFWKEQSHPHLQFPPKNISLIWTIFHPSEQQHNDNVFYTYIASNGNMIHWVIIFSVHEYYQLSWKEWRRKSDNPAYKIKIHKHFVWPWLLICDLEIK